MRWRQGGAGWHISLHRRGTMLRAIRRMSFSVRAARRGMWPAGRPEPFILSAWFNGLRLATDYGGRRSIPSLTMLNLEVRTPQLDLPQRIRHRCL